MSDLHENPVPSPHDSGGHDSGGIERRRHPRRPVGWPLRISLPDGEHEARLRDISRAGLCFFLDRRIPEMTLLRLRIEPPANGGPPEAVEGGGVVVRCRPLSPHVDHYEIAVFLNELDASNRRRLEGVLTRGT
jgi:hypothetical protein